MADPVLRITAVELFSDYLLELRTALDQSYGMLKETTSLLELLIAETNPGSPMRNNPDNCSLVAQEARDSIQRIRAFLPELDRVRLMKADETDVEEGEEAK